MIDSHCHLADKAFNTDRKEVIKRAQNNGITHMITISDSFDDFEKNMQIAKDNDHIFCTVGIHPHNAKTWNDDYLNAIRSSYEQEAVVGVGEIGLDYHYDFSPRESQQFVFEAQLMIAKEMNAPVSVHSRESIDDTWKIVNAIKPPKLVLHCCCEKLDNVSRFIDCGYLLSFTGIATFPKSDLIRETIRQCPLESMMIETDAPYLAPDPYRGRRCEPTHVIDVAQCIADVKGISLEEVDEVTSGNAREFFNI